MNNIKLVFDDKEIIVRLDDNITARELIKELPITLSFSDYSRNEKVAYTGKKYSIDDNSSIHPPSRGDLMFFASWGYLALFYNDYAVARGYVLIGKVISGLMHLCDLKGSVRIEAAA